MIRQHPQILALTSPLRLALLGMLEASGPTSVAALASMVGAKPDALYYHLRILEKRGLVRRVSGDRTAFELATQLTLSYQPSDKRNRDAIVRVAGAIVRGALRAFTAAFAHRPRVSGKRRELWAAQQIARLTDAELEKVNKLLGQILETFEGARGDRPGKRLYSVTFLLSPQEK